MPTQHDVTEHAKQLFDEYDKDGDGYLSHAEVRHAFRALRVPVTLETVEAFMQSVDKNKDSRLSKAEFAAFAAKRQAEVVQAFREIDVNGDGIISHDDITIACKRLGLNLTETDIQRLIKHVDQNATGDVDFNEFCNLVLLVGELRAVKVFELWLRHSALDTGEYSPPPDAGTSTWVLLVSGGIAGAISRTATAPMDRLKTLLQASTSGKSTGIMAGLRGIYQEGGWRAFWRGNGTNVIKIAPETACKFWAYETIKKLIVQDPEQITMIERFTSGALAGALAQCMVYPMEITKTRMALSARGEYHNLRHCFGRTLHREGFKGLYRGLGASLAGIIPYSGVDLTVYSLLRDFYASRYEEDPGVGTLLCCGAISTTCGQLVAYPLQLIRTRLQAQGMRDRPVVYSGGIDCFRKTVQADGFLGLYRGILPNFLKSLPAISISYAVYESSKRWLGA